LVVNSEIVRHGFAGFHFFSFTPFGVPILALGILYMVFARRWLPARAGRESATAGRPSLHDWIEEYGLADREHRLRVTDRPPPVGRTLADLDLRATSGADVLAVERTRQSSRDLIQPAARAELQAGDVLLIDLFGPDTGIEALQERWALEPLPLTGTYFADR